MGSNLVPVSKSGLVKGEALLPILAARGKAARFAYQEFFYGQIRNPHTRVAYHRAVRKFLLACQDQGLLDSIDTSHVVGLRDRAIIGIMVYTLVRDGAVAKLKRRHFYFSGDQWLLRFLEKGGKSREIPVRSNLQPYLEEYIEAAGLGDAPKNSPLFRTAIRKEKRLTQTALTTNDVYRMLKRRMRDAGLPPNLSGHSFRVAGITDLLNQGVPIEDVQHLAGHADPRTTRLYDRRQRRVTRNIVEPTSWCIGP